MINRRFKDYFDKNELNEEDYDNSIGLKQNIFKILNAETLKDANKLRDEIINKNYPKNKFTIKLIGKFIVLYFKKLTTHRKITIFPLQTIKLKISSKKYFQNI